MTTKTLTRVGGGSVSVVPGTIMSAQTHGSGTLLKVRNPIGAIDNISVTDAVATVILDTTMFLVTPVGSFGSIAAPKYIRAETVASFEAAAGGTLLLLLSDDTGADRGASLLVSESVSTIQSRIDAAVAAGGAGGGGSVGSITATGTTQGTAAAITTKTVRITAGAALTGVILTAATAGEECYVQNATTTTKVVYPVTGEFIDPSGVNEGVTIGPGEAVLFKSTLAAHWSSEIQVSNFQLVTPSGTTQGGGQIKTGVTDAYVTGVVFGTTAVTLPPALPGARINVTNVGGAVSGRLYPSGTDTINGGGAGVSVFLPITVTTTISLVCNVAGEWISATSLIKSIVAEEIRERTTGADVTVNDAGGLPMLTLASTLATLYGGLQVGYAEGIAHAGGGRLGATQVQSTLFNCNVCATLGDSLVIAGDMNFTIVTNTGVAPAYLYCPSGATMNGVTDGYIIIEFGQIYQLEGIGATTPYAWTSTLLYSDPGSYQADPTTPPQIVAPGATITTVTTPLDQVQLNRQQQSVVLVNSGANVALLMPPAGDSINGTSFIQLPIRSITHIQYTAAGNWIALFLFPGIQDDTASTGSDQATGTPIIGEAVICNTCANAGDSFTINTTSKMFYFSNKGANAADVFPPSGGTINGGLVDAAISVAAAAAYIFISNDGFVWDAILQ